jgi:hypothetical protein
MEELDESLPIIQETLPFTIAPSRDKSSERAPTRARARRSVLSTSWTREDESRLTKLVVEHGTRWTLIASHFPDRSTRQVVAHWEKVVHPDLVRGSWSPQEDKMIFEWVQENGVARWAELAAQLTGRIGKQCRERYFNHLDPTIKKEPWSSEEDRIVMEGVQKYGRKWVELARLLPGRTENSIKNRWNAALRKKNAAARGESSGAGAQRRRRQQEEEEGEGEGEDELSGLSLDQ